MTEEQLSALLRIKRYEQPPSGYFDRLLQDVHRRQRAELLRRPLWKIALERTHVFFSEHSMGHLTYAGSMATLLIVGVTAIRLVTGSDVQRASKAVAVAPVSVTAPGRSLTLEVPAPSSSMRTFPVAVAQAEPSTVAAPPRYIIDARPVSYEPSRNIDF